MFLIIPVLLRFILVKLHSIVVHVYFIGDYIGASAEIMSERELIKEFKSIACDEALTDQEILTYLQWAKNKVDVALNYYFNRI